ncbi:MAG TPA: DNA double-strand break repair nuclease NurA [Anaerolineales bacterium]|nr:DNA double-strand break repair nuclease NurA [Anaerolineales bacterium]
MALDFQQVRQQVTELGANALQRQRELEDRRAEALRLLEIHAGRIEELRQKVQEVVRSHDPSLRCALPVHERLDACIDLPPLPAQASILAADGSQIFVDRHAEVEYGLVNVGVIQMQHAAGSPPVIFKECKLFYDAQASYLSDTMLSLRRDMKERILLAEQAAQAPAPVITFTDGPMELWGAKGDGGDEAAEFQRSLDEYLHILEQMYQANVTTAGYVDKPSAELVVRLLEVAKAGPEQVKEMRDYRPLQRVRDMDLYRDLLKPGQRSAVFAMQSQSAKRYKDALALHFFYLNVGRGRQGLARVEIPAWVAKDQAMLDGLHAVLIHQCRIMGARPYPYLLHRAHETAVVSHDEQEEVTQMILHELTQLGIPVEGRSFKQAGKDLGGRTRHKL